MKSRNGLKVSLLSALLVLLCSSVSGADMSVLFFDDFDDGNYDGWTVENRTTASTAVQAPEVVASPQGYAVRGTGTGYHPDWCCFITHPINLKDGREVSIEMRAKSGPQWPNSATTYLLDGQDFYFGRDYGESNQKADWTRWKNDQTDQYRYSIGQRAYEWHTFAWTRDLDGWWSLSIDGVVEAPNFRQDLTITSFDHVELELHRNQSEIEWVRISGAVVPVPGAFLLGSIGLGVASAMMRRRGSGRDDGIESQEHRPS